MFDHLGDLPCSHSREEGPGGGIQKAHLEVHPTASRSIVQLDQSRRLPRGLGEWCVAIATAHRRISVIWRA